MYEMVGQEQGIESPQSALYFTRTGRGSHCEHLPVGRGAATVQPPSQAAQCRRRQSIQATNQQDATAQMPVPAKLSQEKPSSRPVSQLTRRQLNHDALVSHEFCHVLRCKPFYLSAVPD